MIFLTVDKAPARKMCALKNLSLKNAALLRHGKFNYFRLENND